MDEPEKAEWCWRVLLDREQEHFEELLRDPDPPRAIVLVWWQSVADVLREYRRRLHRHGTGVGPAPPPLTMDLANRLCNIVGEFANGRIPDPVRAVSTSGRQSLGAAERNCIEMAVAYIRACEPGGLTGPDGVVMSVTDEHPVKTIAKWFGANRSTVYAWKANYSPADFGDCSPRKTLVDDDEDPAWSEAVRGLVFYTKRAAFHYQALGRTSKSILARAHKRGGTARAKKVRSPSRPPK